MKAALRETEQFLAEAQEECLGSVRIVYGKGKRSPGSGRPARGHPGWLDGEGHRFVRRWERCPDATGADGGMIVWVGPPDEDEEEASVIVAR